MAVAGPGGVNGRCSKGGLTACSTAVGDITLLLPDGCTFSLLIGAGREVQVLQALPESQATTVHILLGEVGENPQPVAVVLI